MNTKHLSLIFVALVLTVVVSGCVSTPEAPADTSGEDQQAVEQQQNEVLNELESEIISEDDTVEIGEMI